MSSKQVPDYYDVVKTPIDLSTIRQVITDKSASFFTMKLSVPYCSAGRRMSVCCRFVVGSRLCTEGVSPVVGAFLLPKNLYHF